jgi:hypothetical protein
LFPWNVGPGVEWYHEVTDKMVCVRGRAGSQDGVEVVEEEIEVEVEERRTRLNVYVEMTLVPLTIMNTGGAGQVE